MWKLTGLILACFLIYATAEAAVRTPLQTAATAVGNGIPMTVDDKGSAGMTVTGTFDGTIAFEGSADGGTTWSALTCTEVASLSPFTTTTTTGQYQCPVAGLSHARARISVFTSGSITVVGTASNGSLGSAGGVGVSATATAAAPSYVEGYTRAALSVDLSGGLRTSLVTLLSCEDQPNSLCRVSPGVPLISTVMTGVTTNTTSAAIVIFSGGKTPIAQVVGTGAVTATIDLYGDNDSDAANGLGLCTITLSGTTKAAGGCDGAKQITRDFAFYYASTTNVTGTGATVKLEVASGMAGYTGNISQINGATPLMGAGNTGTGSQRVTEATDSQLSAGVGATGDAVVAAGATGSVSAKLRQLTNLTLDPCSSVAKSYASINGTAGATLITGTSAKKIYPCSFNIITAAAENIAIVSGTGTVCATGITAIPGLSGGTTAATGWNFAANGGIVIGTGATSIAQVANNADNLCILVSGSGQKSGGLSYVVQ